MGALLRVGSAILLACVAAVPLQGQRNVGGARLEVLLPPPNSNGMVDVGAGPRISIGGALQHGQIPELMRNGFPARVTARLELWRSGDWFDDNETTLEWEMIVGYDAASESYQVRRRLRDQMEHLGGFTSLAAAEAALERPFRVPIAPKQMGRRYYYNLAVEVEALSLSDLDELERWLRGDLRPAVRGRRSPLAAFGRGTRIVVIRVLGGERRRFETRSATFRSARGSS
jgi:hypothetical protein